MGMGDLSREGRLTSEADIEIIGKVRSQWRDPHGAPLPIEPVPPVGAGEIVPLTVSGPATVP